VSEHYEVTAVRFATAPTARRQEFWHFDLYGAEDAPMTCDFYFWVITGGDQVILFDTGFTEPVAVAHNQQFLAPMAQCLAELGLTAGDVGTIIYSHLHYDHVGNLGLFPGAEIIVQGAELDFWTSPMARRPLFAMAAEQDYLDDLVAADAQGRVRRISGDTPLAAGIDALDLSGHTAGQQGLRVQTAARPVVLASDAAHYAQELSEDWPFQITDSLSGMYAAYDRLRAMQAAGDVIVPGHAAEVLADFPARRFGDGGVAVRVS
jgi:glyoxylase-like metal-dependent hydrolase (beta-lactamase superfamily II)